MGLINTLLKGNAGAVCWNKSGSLRGTGLCVGPSPLGSPLVDDALGSPLVDDALGSPLVDDAASVAGPEETRAVTSQVRPHERYMQKRRAQLSASQRSEESG